ncbi:MAG TPA: fumarylacetoacetase [Solirubrobacteraceae bacterium]|jgi:fumarylacetoacetase|nr:fumarylacetoacetase [Solirubrobacteraceae bacterium]
MTEVDVANKLDATHAPARRSWVASANGPDTDFPIQNLPLGVARDAEGRRALSTAIGDQVLELAAAAGAGLLSGVPAEIAVEAPARGLNQILSRPRRQLIELRHQLAELLDAGAAEQPQLLRPMSEVTLELPCAIGSFTDFYAGIHHARAVSEILTPGSGLGSNYKWVPIGYQSRASAVRPSGVPVRRPRGQRLAEGASTPSFGACEKLDFELELGFYVSVGNELGEPVSISHAGDHIGGFCLLNDWSARDLQMWEMVPLGPFLSKGFATTVSPWVVTADAMTPFRVGAMPRPDGDPPPLDYLNDEADQVGGGLAIELTVWLQSERMRAAGVAPVRLLDSDARHLYWTPTQMLAHHTSNGCNLSPGDLLGTGTVSGPDDEQRGSMLELTHDAQRLVELPGGEQRGYLQDGDGVTLTGRCVADGFQSIGFGPCSAIVTGAVAN